MQVVLAEKVSSALGLPFEAGDLVLFGPPPELQQLVTERGGKPLGSRDLFVKRVAAVGGDTVELLPSGDVAVNGVRWEPPPLACASETLASESTPPTTAAGDARSSKDDRKAQPKVVPQGSVFVLGDCPARSTDSRSWGPLPMANVVARPVVRVWPIERQGAIVDTQDLNPFRRLVERAQRPD